MSKNGEEHLFEEILRASEQNPSLQLDELLTLFPGREDSVRRFWAALVDYRRSSELLRSSPKDALAPGERVGDFVIEELEGRGGMGEVYRARQLSLNRRWVALKVLSRATCTPKGVARFHREAVILAELHHPNLVEIYAVGETSGVLFYAMRLVSGFALQNLLGEPEESVSEPPSIRDRVEWIAQVASALSVLHRAGLVHRDVKPSNIMIEAAEDPKGPQRAVLVDFGLVRPTHSSELTMTADAAATPGYAAPEQLLGRPVDARADVFALGVTLHDLLTLRVPSSRLPATAGLEPLDSLVPGADADLSAVASKALDPDARWRYASAAEFGEDLERWLQGKEVLARKPPLGERCRRWIRDHPGRITGLFTAIAGLTLSGIIVAALTGYLGSARELRAAHSRMDLVSLVEAAGRIPAWLSPPLLRNESLVEVAARARELSGDDPLTAVVDSLRRDDTTEALLIAARRVSTVGLGSDRLLQAFLVEALQRYEREPGAGDELLVLVARLFLEEPVSDSAQREEARPFRTTLTEVLFDKDRRLGDRLLAISALSGCGDARDALPLLELGFHHPHGSEEHRLAVACAERIIRRCIGGQLGDLPHRDIAMLIAPHVRPVFQDWATTGKGGYINTLHVAELVKALALASRAAGYRLEPGAFMPAEWAVPASLSDYELRLALEVLAAFADERARPLLMDGVFFDPSGRQGSVWGSLVGVFGDPSLTSKARQSCRERAPELGTALLDPAIFEKGVTAGSLLRECGRWEATEPDRETRLDAIWDGPESQDLDVQVAEAIHDVAQAEAGHDVAKWDLMTSPPTVGGTAKGIQLSLTDMRKDERGRPYLWMWNFEGSEARFRFSIEEEPEVPMVLRFRHQPALRSYNPFEGEVRLQIMVDDKALSSYLVVDGSTDEIPIPVRLLNRGAHALSIRCDRGSTTTFRLYRVSLREGQ